MIDPQYRFWVNGWIIFGEEHTSYIVDWDQRRWYKVIGSKKLLQVEQHEENIEIINRPIEYLKRHIDHLSQKAFSITIDDQGLLASVSSEDVDDSTVIPTYPRFTKSLSLQDCSTIELSKLKELDRLGPEVDLMSYVDESGIQREVVFKYGIIFQTQKRTWRELHLNKDLPSHPNLVPFDRVVVDDEVRVLGFTTQYIPGGSLDKNRKRVFRLEWLQQLIALVDYLNLELNIIHHDIAPRNLVINPETDKIQLFDFEHASRIGECESGLHSRNDVAGVIFTLYEIVTQSEDCRDVDFMTSREAPFDEQDAKTVQNLGNWPIKCKLDADIAAFRKELNDWVRQRTEVSESLLLPQVKVPDIPAEPPRTPFIEGHDEKGEQIYHKNLSHRRPDARRRGLHFMDWERPPQQEANLQKGIKRRRSQDNIPENH